MADYLVTGGAGFIGSNIVEQLLKEGNSVRVIDNFSTGRRENLQEAEKWAAEGKGKSERVGGKGNFELIEGDIRSLETARRAVKDCRFVLHQAAIPSVVRSVRDPVTTSEVNIQGTLNLLVAARDEKIERFVYASSSSVYGESEVLPKVETMPPSPLSPYATQKLTGEYYCRIFHSLFGLPTVSLRYFNVFGPRQDPTSEYAAVIPKFITAALSGKRPVIYGDGKQTRDFSFIRNVVEANIKAAKAPKGSFGKVFNIAGGSRIDLLELLAIISDLAGKRVDPEFAPPRPGDIRDSLADISRARTVLGYEGKVSVREGLEKALHWYKERF
ncbi:MAG: SDR family oxidoreductase [Acidobacteriota bacterium]